VSVTLGVIVGVDDRVRDADDVRDDDEVAVADGVRVGAGVAVTETEPVGPLRDGVIVAVAEGVCVEGRVTLDVCDSDGVR
jgi:hypothetical protein